MITDEMIAEAAAELNEAMIKSLPDPHECKHQFSKKFERKMDKLIYRVNHPIRYKIVSRVASVLLVILLGFTVVMSCSPTARAAVIGWIKQAYESFYTYYFNAEKKPIVNDKYHIDPLPEGYIEITNSNDGGTCAHIFFNEQNEMLVFSYSQNHEDSIFFVEKENFLVEETFVNGKAADLYITKDNNMANGIIWCDEDTGLIFYISGCFDGEELKTIAENVEKCPK